MTEENEIPLSEIHELSRLSAQLTLEGFKLDYCGGNCPIQIGGWMPTGEYFHFRSRGEHVSIEVWQKDFEPREPHMGWCPDSKPAFEAVKRAGDWPEAGWFECHKANKHLRRLLKAYRAWKEKPVPAAKSFRSFSLKKHNRMMRRSRKRNGG
jgi:hypothetical protein